MLVRHVTSKDMKKLCTNGVSLSWTVSIGHIIRLLLNAYLIIDAYVLQSVQGIQLHSKTFHAFQLYQSCKTTLFNCLSLTQSSQIDMLRPHYTPRICILVTIQGNAVNNTGSRINYIQRCIDHVNTTRSNCQCTDSVILLWVK